MRRYFQLSLRSLLALVTLIGIGTAVWLRIEKPRRAFLAAEQLVKRVGGAMGIEAHTWSIFNRVVSLDLSETAVTDKDLFMLADLGGLRELDLSDTAVTNAILPQISECRDLRVVRMGDTAVTPDVTVATLELERLNELTVGTLRGLERPLGRMDFNNAVFHRRGEVQPLQTGITCRVIDTHLSLQDGAQFHCQNWFEMTGGSLLITGSKTSWEAVQFGVIGVDVEFSGGASVKHNNTVDLNASKLRVAGSGTKWQTGGSVEFENHTRSEICDGATVLLGNWIKLDEASVLVSGEQTKWEVKNHATLSSKSDAQFREGATVRFGNWLKIDNATVQVAGRGTSFETAGAVEIGNEDLATFSIQDGARAQFGNWLTLGRHSGRGTMEVSGENSQLKVKSYSTVRAAGQLRISDQAVVEILSRLEIGDQKLEGQATVIIGSEGRLSTKDQIELGTHGDALISLAKGTITAREIEISAYGTLSGTGQITAPIENAGWIAVAGKDRLHVAGSLTQTQSGRIEIELLTNDCGQVKIDGAAKLDGTLDVVTIATQWPESAKRYVVLSADSIEGAFHTLKIPNALAGRLTLDYQPQEVALLWK